MRNPAHHAEAARWRSENSILLIDFVIEEMQRGMAPFDATIEAGHKRAQPIMMTDEPEHGMVTAAE